MCEAFADGGIEVTLLFARDWGSARPAGDMWEACGVRRVFEIEGLPSVNIAPLGKWLPGGLLGAWLKAAWGLSLLTFTLASIGWLRRRGPSDVYSREALPLWVLTRLRRLEASRMFFEAHSVPTSRPGRWLRRQLAVAGVGFVMVTDHLRQRYDALGIRPRRYLVAHDGVRVERFGLVEDRAAARSRLGWPQADFMVGYLGRTRTLGMDKGVAAMLEAVDALRTEDRRRAVRAVLLGPSPAEVRQLGYGVGRPDSAADLVLAPGWVNPADVPLYLRGLNVCVLPLPWTDHFAYAASPLKLFEYMASGTPIVASNLPAVAEILRDGENALLVPPGDVAALTDAIRRLRDDPILGAELARQAKQDVREFTWDKRAMRIVEIMTEPHG
jgi:glycosyltransferase involved in cell wall biosynthesis